MKNYVGMGVAFGAGAIFGAVLTILTTKKRVERQVEKRVNDILKESEGSNNTDAPEARENSGEKKEETKNEASEEGESGTGGSVNHAPPVDFAELEAPSEASGEENKDEIDLEIEEYEDMVKNYNLITDENQNDYEGLLKTKETNSGKKPRIITQESYDNEYLHFEKVPLDYYAGNDVLVEALTNQEVIDVDRAVGDCLDKYNFRKSDEEAIYVRNFSYNTDYEISKYFTSFDGE